MVKDYRALMRPIEDHVSGAHREHERCGQGQAHEPDDDSRGREAGAGLRPVRAPDLPLAQDPEHRALYARADPNEAFERRLEGPERRTAEITGEHADVIAKVRKKRG